MLGNEPWCWPPRVVGRLTDFQAWEIVLKPALERHRKRSRGDPPRGGKALPDREEYIEIGLRLGGDREQLGREFDKWAATQGGGDGSDT